MKYDRLKKKLVKESLLLGGALVALLLVFGTLSAKESSLNDELSSLNRDSSTLLSQAVNSEEENKQIAESFKIYKTLSSNKLASDDFDRVIGRITGARGTIVELGSRYKMSLDRIDITHPKDISRDVRSKTLKVLSGEIFIEYGALTDEMVFSFCYSMIKELPGYVTIKDLEIKKSNNVSPEIYSLLRNKNADLPKIVSGKIIFDWKTLKDAKKKPDGTI